ncbi:MAG: protocatechuate 3,4-dioxygenase [Hyphomicrobiaceae bacterium]|nr:protocatechuate 3,4-dioxygenase [Hyphomicrobiaceae bacterium]
MRHWAQDVLFTRRGLIACAAGLVVARASHAGLTPTPPQTPGPFYPRVKPSDSDADLTRIANGQGVAAGEVIEISGRALSVKGDTLEGAVVEIWQADVNGRYIDPRDNAGATPRDRNFQGYGVVRTRADGSFRFRTIRPAPYDTGVGLRTPHIHFRVVHGTRGELVTQMYFPGDPRNDQDFLYRELGSRLVRDAATAELQTGGNVAIYVFDMVLA